jgi:hypothetical protein
MLYFFKVMLLAHLISFAPKSKMFVNEISKINQYLLIWFKIYCSTTKHGVYVTTLAIAHVQSNGTQVCNLEFVDYNKSLWL